MGIREGADLGNDVVHLILLMNYDVINSRGGNLIESHGPRRKTPRESQEHKIEETNLRFGSSSRFVALRFHIQLLELHSTAFVKRARHGE